MKMSRCSFCNSENVFAEHTIESRCVFAFCFKDECIAKFREMERKNLNGVKLHWGGHQGEWTYKAYNPEITRSEIVKEQI